MTNRQIITGLIGPVVAAIVLIVGLGAFGALRAAGEKERATDSRCVVHTEQLSRCQATVDYWQTRAHAWKRRSEHWRGRCDELQQQAQQSACRVVRARPRIFRRWFRWRCH